MRYINWEKEIKKKLERHGAFDFERLEEQTEIKNPNFEELRELFGDTFYFSEDKEIEVIALNKEHYEEHEKER